MENVGENKTAIVQYLPKHLSVDKLKVMVQNLFMHLSVEAIRSKLKHFQLYDQHTRPVHMYNLILRGLKRTQNNSIPL